MSLVLLGLEICVFNKLYLRDFFKNLSIRSKAEDQCSGSVQMVVVVTSVSFDNAIFCCLSVVCIRAFHFYSPVFAIENIKNVAYN